MSQQKHRWIDDSVVIDFPLKPFFQEKIAILERLDEEDNDFYFEEAESLEYCVKRCVLAGSMTSYQAEVLSRKFG